MAREKKDVEPEPAEEAVVAEGAGGAPRALSNEDPGVQEAVQRVNASVAAYEQRLIALEDRVRTHFRDHHKFVESVWK